MSRLLFWGTVSSLFIAAVLASDVLITESGLKLPIHVIRKNLPSVPEHQLGDAIFEHTESKVLVSRSLRLDVYSIAQDIEIVSPNSSVILTVNGQSETLTGGPTLRKGDGYTFAYAHDEKEDELVAAWGNGINLYPLHRKAYPGVFINIAQRNLELSPTKGISSKLVSSTRNTCVSCSNEVPRYLENLAAFDNFWCGRYGNNANVAARTIQALIQQANQPFARQTCVRLKLISIDAHCEDPKNPYMRPAPNSNGLVDSRMIISMFQSYWTTNFSRVGVPRDLAILFTGYEDDTPSDGTVFSRGSSCNIFSGFAWVELPDPYVVAREVGNTLSTGDQSSGIMVGRGESTLEFSDSSLPRIRDFMVSCRSHCITSQFATLVLPPGPRVPLEWRGNTRVPGWFGDSSSGGGIAFGDISGTGKSDIFVMHIDNPHFGNRGYYRVGKNVRRNRDGSYNVERWMGPYNVHGAFGHHNSGGGIAFGNIQDSNSKDILIFHIDNPLGGNRGYYRIGFAMDANGKVSRWSKLMGIPANWGHENDGGGIALGGIRGPSSKDLVVMYITDHRGGNAGYYRVGFDLGPDGRVRGGWSSVMRVEGWFGDHSDGAGVALYDTNGNGKLDIVVFHIDDPRGGNRGYFRVGRDLDTNGRVTNGWSSPQRIPSWLGSRNQGGGIAVRDLGSGVPTTAAFLIDNPSGGNSGFIRFGYGTLAF